MKQSVWKKRFMDLMTSLKSKGVPSDSMKDVVWSHYWFMDENNSFGYRWVSRYIHDNLTYWITEFNRREV